MNSNYLSGLAGADTPSGGDGNDTIDGGAGADAINGGNGTDRLTYVSASFAVSLNLVPGVHTGDAAGDVFSEIEIIAGSNYADTYTANAEITLEGGVGNDTYAIGSNDVVIVENSGGGTDTVQAGLANVLGANIENLVYVGSGSANFTGNALNNMLTGG